MVGFASSSPIQGAWTQTNSAPLRLISVAGAVARLEEIAEDRGAGRLVVDRGHAIAEGALGRDRTTKVLLLDLAGVGSLGTGAAGAIQAGLVGGTADAGAAGGAGTGVAGRGADHGERA